MSPKIQQLLFCGTIGILCTVSTTCLLIHFQKFIKCPTPQSLATKNLTFYCLFLLIFYLISLIHLNWYELKYHTFDETESILPYGLALMTFLLLTTTFFKFIIATDIFLCFRQIALYLQRPSGPQNIKFLNYCLLGIGVPSLYTALFLITNADKNMEYLCKIQIWAMRIIRIARLVPIVGSFWYINKASIDKHELWSRFSLHLRLLIMLGGFSAGLSVVELISCLFDDEMSKMSVRNSDWVYFFVQFIGAVLEGLVIGILFTFRKDTFKPISAQ